MTRTAHTRRSAYTLIELLVVMALIITLAAIAVFAYPTFGDSQMITRGADRVSGALLIAKQTAKRDGGPRGVRFLVNPSAPTRITEFQYIEQPDPWVPNPDQELNPSGPRIVFVYWTDPMTTPPNQVPNNSTFREVYFVSTSASAGAELTELVSRVQSGDALVLPEINGRYAPDQGSTYRVWKVGGQPSNPIQIGPNPADEIKPQFARRLFLGVQPPNNPPPASVSAPPVPPYVVENYPDLGAANSGARPTPYPPLPPSTPIPATAVTYKFGFQPAARPMFGEPLLQMGGEVFVDFRNPSNTSIPPFNPPTTIGVVPDAGNTFFDVLFAPSGQVLNNPFGFVCLWVRKDVASVPHPRTDGTGTAMDPRATYDAAKEQFLVTVYTRTGYVAVHPVALPPSGFAGWTPVSAAPHDPFQYARDGANSGF